MLERNQTKREVSNNSARTHTHAHCNIRRSEYYFHNCRNSMVVERNYNVNTKVDNRSKHGAVTLDSVHGIFEPFQFCQSFFLQVFLSSRHFNYPFLPFVLESQDQVASHC